VLRCEGWIPSNRREDIERVLDVVTSNKGVGRAVLTDQEPKGDHPTSFETNKFTKSFQLIVDTYGVPRYQEFNPAVPTIVTFPFLFGVMYGDIFHGSCLFLFASLLVFGESYWQRQKLGEMAQSIFSGRYVLFLMGIFAIYCGLIYNDCMSIMINGWNGSQWTWYASSSSVVMIQRKVYAVGVDPVWHALDNQLTYENSLKMKLAVIIGVIQMTFGLFIKLANHIHEHDMVSVFFEFVPQLIFMLVFFGYMVFLIFYKWFIDWGHSDLPSTPSLITVLIKMVLSPGTVDDSLQVLPSASTQATIQLIFVFLMLISVPWMLFFKPFILKRKHERGHRYEPIADEHKEPDEEPEAEPQHVAHGHGHGHDEHEFEFSEVMIHQLIHTIEYVLGTVSNTASYLRLWALSLAHAELSEVFYEKTIESTLNGTGALYVVMTVVGVFMFFMFTFGVLMIMDVLECFLHALRLHWVEFQNKFYYADGVAFRPFSYDRVLQED